MRNQARWHANLSSSFIHTKSRRLRTLTAAAILLCCILWCKSAFVVPAPTSLHVKERHSPALWRRITCRAGEILAGLSRGDLQILLFENLDSDGDGRLNLAEMRRLAEYNGFEGTDEEWEDDFSFVCPQGGCDIARFCKLLNDDSEDGCFASDEDLREMITALPPMASGTKSGSMPTAVPSRNPPRPVGLDFFADERKAGLYGLPNGQWKEWDPVEGYTVRSPRVGTLARELEGCGFGSDATEAFSYLSEQIGAGGTFAQEASGTAEERLGRVLSLAGSGSSDAFWTTFKFDESKLSTEELEKLTLAPSGWKMDYSTIPRGYCMHILTAGRGNTATIFAGQELPLHRDVSNERPRRLCDTILAGITGRKRVIIFSPDEFPANSKKPRNVAYAESEKLQPLLGMSQDEAWMEMEKLASRQDVIGGVLNLEPGKFVFLPFGWWHAVRPIDDFSFITGPCHSADFGPPDDE